MEGLSELQDEWRPQVEYIEHLIWKKGNFYENTRTENVIKGYIIYGKDVYNESPLKFLRRIPSFCPCLPTLPYFYFQYQHGLSA